MDTTKNTYTIDIDSKSGFCFGVVNAIGKAEESLQLGKTIYCLGDIVHNGAEVERLEKLGLITITHAEYEKLTNVTVLLRAHGEPPSTYEIAKKNNITLIDATCPVVLKLQKRIKEGYESTLKNGGQVVIFGKPGHAEVIGLLGQTNNTAILVTNENDIDAIDFSRPVYLYSQTTKSLHAFNALQNTIREKMQNEKGILIEFKSFDTVCRQVSNREEELRNFAKQYEAIVFVSGKKSSNGKVLFDICKQENENTYFVSDNSEIERTEILQASSIGVCGATSTPKWLMQSVVEKINELRTKI